MITVQHKIAVLLVKRLPPPTGVKLSDLTKTAYAADGVDEY
jgi:hypothetical protein